MRIGLVYLGRRGGGVSCNYELATHLAKREAVLAVLSEYVENLTLWQNSGLELLTTTTYRSTPGAVLAWFNHIKLHRLAKQIRTWQPDVLVYPLFYTLNPFLQMHLGGIPSVVAVHDPQPHPGLRDRAYHFIENLSIRQATRCYVLSQAFRIDLQRRGVRPEQIDHVPHADLSYYRRFAPQTAAPPPQKAGELPILLFFGRVTAYKGLEVLLQAYRQVRQRRPVRLLIAGDGDLRPYQPLLEGLPDVEIANRWIDESEIHTFFERATLLVAPYTSASQSGVVAIAAGFGLAVVATLSGGIPEQIQHGVTGILVQPGSVDELVKAIDSLLDDPARARALGQNLREDTLTNRNWDKIAEMVGEVCAKAVDDHAKNNPRR
jgi:glycosyltransferase involved in cell wall biosynthesis